MIHSTAIVHPGARLDPTVQVGPYAVIDAGVTIGAHCVVGPHTYLTGETTIGSHNRFFAGCVVGEAPQDLHYKGEPTRLRIGDHNEIREHVTIHRSTKMEQETVLGSHNLLMASSHVAHNAHIGNHVVMVNGSLVAGYAQVDDYVVLGGISGVHQYCRVGTLAMIQGNSGLSVDLPPYTIACKLNILCGLNTVGMRRAGISSAHRLELKQLYRDLFRGGVNMRSAVSAAREKYSSPPSVTMLDFISASKRGVCSDISRDPMEFEADEE